jgi:aconitate hydratase
MAQDARENGYPLKLASALIGSCTNSSYEDLERAADVARQATAHGVKAKTKLWVTPGSEQIHQTIKRDGQTRDFDAIGGIVLANACGPCIGQWKRDDIQQGDSNSIISSYNRNFRRRNDGNAETLSFIGSPEIVVAYALAGTLDFDPCSDEIEAEDGTRFKLAPPADAPEVPARGFVESHAGYAAPPPESERAAAQVVVADGSERLERLEPFAPWDGNDSIEVPLLLKAKGKCTTDHISPAGPWLRFRGHLTKISDNMFLGAVNAFTDETGTGLDQLSGERGVGFSELAKRYQAAGKRWVVVGDENYGEGSSREHAAMSPRLLGGAAVLVRSFARIAESNLKKQGVLPLSFADAADYEKVQERDTVSVLGLSSLAAGQSLQVVFHHADGSSDEVSVSHTLSDEQIEWFRAGSALNLLRRQKP